MHFHELMKNIMYLQIANVQIAKNFLMDGETYRQMGKQPSRWREMDSQADCQTDS